MSTIEDFENAPVGSTAKKEGGLRAIREDDGTDQYPWVCTTYGELLSNEELAERGYALERPVPTTSHEALDLAWELAHPVKEGQAIPVGTWLVERKSNGITVGKNDYFDVTANWWDAEHRRTLDPLTDSKPDWLNAPAVMAVGEGFSYRRIWVPLGDGGWASVQDGRAHWRELEDVTPLYPKLYPKEGQES